MIRLLDKKELAQQRSNERKLEIEEGVKLARKVDALRETVAVEEVKLSKFKTETTSQVKAEIDALIIEKGLIETEVTLLRKERIDLQKPLDAEWEKLRAKEKIVQNLSEIIEGKLDLIDQLEQKLDEREASIKVEEEKIDDAKKTLEKEARDSAKNLERSQNMLKEAFVEKQSIDTFSNNKELDFLRREGGIATRERNLDMRAQSLDKREKSLNDREIRLQDREQTLLRNEKRLWH